LRIKENRMPTEYVTATLPYQQALIVGGFLSGTLQQMKERATAVEWDSLEVQIVRLAITELLKQLPKGEKECQEPTQ